MKSMPNAAQTRSTGPDASVLKHEKEELTDTISPQQDISGKTLGVGPLAWYLFQTSFVFPGSAPPTFYQETQDNLSHQHGSHICNRDYHYPSCRLDTRER